MPEYRDFNINPGLYTGYSYVHKDYDGPEDRRAGNENTEQDCKNAVDEWHFSEALDLMLAVRSATRGLDDMVFNVALRGKLTADQAREIKKYAHHLAHKAEGLTRHAV